MNYLQYLLVAAAIAQAVQTEDGSTDRSGRRARAIKAAITAIQPMIPAVATHPEIAEDIGKLIDDLVALRKKVAPAAPTVEIAPAKP